MQVLKKIQDFGIELWEDLGSSWTICGLGVDKKVQADRFKNEKNLPNMSQSKGNGWMIMYGISLAVALSLRAVITAVHFTLKNLWRGAVALYTAAHDGLKKWSRTTNFIAKYDSAWNTFSEKRKILKSKKDCEGPLDKCILFSEQILQIGKNGYKGDFSGTWLAITAVTSTGVIEDDREKTCNIAT